MKKGMGLSAVGGVLVVIGLGFFNPLFSWLFDGRIVPFFELEVAERFVYGLDVPLLRVAAGLAALLVVANLVGLVLRPQRRVGLGTLALALGVLGLTVAVAGRAESAVDAALGPAGLFRGESVVALEGPLFVFLGGAVAVLGALVTLAARPAFAPSDRLLRVALLWNGSVLRESILDAPRDVTIGEDPRATFVLPASATGALPRRFPLVRAERGGRYSLALLPTMTGSLQLGRAPAPAEDVAARHATGAGVPYVPVEPGDWGVLRFGDVAVSFQFVRPDEYVARRRLAALPWDLVGTTTLSAIAQLALILTTVFLWEEHPTRDPRRDEPRTVKAEVVMKQLEEHLPPPLEERPRPVESAVREKAFGSGDVALDEPKNPAAAAPRRRDDPRRTGLNDLLSSKRLGANRDISNILSTDTSRFRNKLALAVEGGPDTVALGDPSSGMRFVGTTGGPTDYYGSVRSLGPVGPSGGPGVALRPGSGRRPPRKVDTLRFGRDEAQGFCARGDIQKSVRLRAGAIRACYEQQLRLRPSLAGKVTVRWTIDLTGGVKVANVVDSTMSNPAVEQCILRAIRRIRFERPEGGICIVNWPFVFSPG